MTRQTRSETEEITVRPVTDSDGWAAFRSVPQRIYRDDPYWVADETVDFDPMLVDAEPQMRERVRTQAFVAYDGAEPVGRILAIFDRRYQERHAEPAAFFGFYEAVPRDPVAFGMLEAAADWARAQNLTRLYGPVNLFLTYGAGLLVSGHGQPALVGMPHNPPYYDDQLTRWGLRKVKDLHSYAVSIPRSDRPRGRADVVNWRPIAGLSFRHMDPTRFDEEIETIRGIYNDAFVDFWGFVPSDPAEFARLADGFRPVLDEELVVFVEVDGRPVGYLMAFPDVNRVSGDGPPRHARIDMLAVHPDYQNTWVGGMLIFEMLRRLHSKGYETAEAAPILEDATWPRSLRGRALQLTRVYRVYGRSLVPGAA